MREKIKIPDNVTNIMSHLIAHGYDAYIIGGAIRDYFLGIIPHDWDLFTNCPDLVNEFPEGNVIGGEERQAKILTVIVDGIEVSQYRANGERTEVGNDLETHLSTCDYNINAMACDINGNIIDLHGGIFDLKHWTFEFVGDGNQRIKEDPLRILRGIRLILKNRLHPSLETETILEENGIKLYELPKERIREEFLKLLKYEKCFDILKEFELLKYIIPDIEKSYNMNGGDYHDETVFEHMNYSFKEACKITDNVFFRLAAGLHDFGKISAISRTVLIDPRTMRAIEDSKTHFYEHERIGAEKIEEWMREYKFAEKEIKYVVTLVRTHMWAWTETISKRSYIKHFKKFEDADIDIMDFVTMTYCDNQGNMKNSRIKFADWVRDSPIHKKYYELKHTNEPFSVKDLAVGGKDLIQLGFKPGPEMGKLLKKLFEKVMICEIKNDKRELITFLKEFKE